MCARTRLATPRAARLVVRRVDEAEVAARALPEVALDEVVARAYVHVGPRAAGRLVLEVAERPRALVGVLRARAVEPGVEVGVCVGLFELVRQHGDGAVDARVAVRAVGLRGAGREAAVRVADERVAYARAVRVVA